jgi:hypothetical protein
MEQQSSGTSAARQCALMQKFTVTRSPAFLAFDAVKSSLTIRCDGVCLYISAVSLAL